VGYLSWKEEEYAVERNRYNKKIIELPKKIQGI